MRCVQCFIIFVLLLLAPLCAYLQFGRSPAVPPVELSSLLLDADDFPSDRWVDGKTGSSTEYLAASDARFGDYHVIPLTLPDGAYQLILWYRNTDLAERRYAAERQRFFFDSSNLISPWQTPEVLDYHSATADEFQLACAKIKCHSCLDGEFTACGAIARYGAFVSMFNVWMSPEYMTHDQLETMLRTIDERMAPYAEE